MNAKKITFLIPILGIIAITLLSSFYKISDQDQASPEPAPDRIKYRSTAKQERQSGLITLSSAFQNDYFTDNNNRGFFYVEVQSDKYLNESYERPPMNMSIVIDRSGSMSGSKIENAKKAANHIVDQLSNKDYLSIITYDGGVNVLHAQARVSNKQLIKNKINRIRPGGSTNLMGGAMKGYEEVNETYRSGYINRVLLLSDGQANEGITDANRIKKIVQAKFREENIALSTFGLGNGYNENLMTAMAENGSGNYYFISRPNDIVGIFKKELNGLMEVVAQNTYLKIEIPNNVTVRKIHGYSFTQNRNIISVKLNDIFSEETKGILMEYAIDRNNLPSKITFKTSLNFRNPKNERNQRITLMNKQTYTDNLTTYNQYFSEWVEGQVVLNDINIKMEEAMTAIDKGDYKRGRNLVVETKKLISAQPKLTESNKEIQRAQQANTSYMVDLEDIEIKSESEKSFIQKSNKSTNYQIRRKK